MPSLGRTPSDTSVSSVVSTLSASSADSNPRRTRRRISSVQLIELETLFRRTSHPTRQEREAVAEEVGMDTKSVTIWFQNKRQTERKSALHKTVNRTGSDVCRPNPIHSTTTTTRNGSSGGTVLRNAPRPSLDFVASRSELRHRDDPRTPSRRHNVSASLWENMLSSPIESPRSSPAREYVEFGKIQSTRTLEWACAAARLAGKEKSVDWSRRELKQVSEGEETACDAITPRNSLGGEVVRRASLRRPDLLPEDVQNDDVMRAALALCTLGGGRIQVT